MQKKGGAADDAAGQKPPGARVEHEHGPPGKFPFGAENRGEGAGVLGEPRGDKPAAGDSGAGAVPVRRAGKAHGRGHALCPGAAGRGHDARARRALCRGGLRAGRADRGLARALRLRRDLRVAGPQRGGRRHVGDCDARDGSAWHARDGMLSPRLAVDADRQDVSRRNTSRSSTSYSAASACASCCNTI